MPYGGGPQSDPSIYDIGTVAEKEEQLKQEAKERKARFTCRCCVCDRPMSWRRVSEGYYRCKRCCNGEGPR